MSVTPTLHIDNTGRVFFVEPGDTLQPNAVLVTVDDKPFAVHVDELCEATVTLNLYRSVDDGITWEPLGDWVSGGVFFDYEGRSMGATTYMAVAETGAGALAVRETVVDADSSTAWLMNAQGEGVGLRYNLDISVPQAAPHSELVWLDGETAPTLIEDSPKSVSRQVTLSADLVPAWLREATETDHADLEGLRGLQAIPGLVTLRLPTGEVVGGSVRSVTPTYRAGKLVGVQVAFEEARAL